MNLQASASFLHISQTHILSDLSDFSSWSIFLAPIFFYQQTHYKSLASSLFIFEPILLCSLFFIQEPVLQLGEDLVFSYVKIKALPIQLHMVSSCWTVVSWQFHVQFPTAGLFYAERSSALFCSYIFHRDLSSPNTISVLLVTNVMIHMLWFWFAFTIYGLFKSVLVCITRTKP